MTVAAPANRGEECFGRRPFHIACWPRDENNPYQSLFYGALVNCGVTVDYPKEIDDAWLHSRAGELSAVHLHWPEQLWRTRGRTWAGRLRGVAGLERFLRLAHRLGLRLIWTVHNFEHHEGAGFIDRLGYRCLARHCDLLICHDSHTHRMVTSGLSPRGLVAMMPHGNYAGVYPQPRPRETVLRELGIPTEARVLSCLGNIRHYKGSDLAAEAVIRLPEHVHLIIAGSVHSSYDAAPLREQCSANGRLHLLEGFLGEQQFADMAAASDALVLPYRSVTGSGALLAALTLERAVVVSDHAFFREICRPEPAAAEFFATGDVRSLSEAMTRLMETPAIQRQAAAARLCERFSWPDCVGEIVPVLQRWMSSQRDGLSMPHISSIQLEQE